MYRRQNLRHRSASLVQLIGHELLSLRVRNQICRTDREAGEQVELRNHRLNVVDQLSAAVRAEVIVDHVNQVAARRLLQNTRRQLTVLDGHAALERNHGEGSGDQLGTRPVATLPHNHTLETSEDIHCDDLRNLYTRLTDAEDTGHGVLEQLDDRAVGTRTNNIS